LGNLGWRSSSQDWNTAGEKVNIVVGSAFRNATHHIIRYLNQVMMLRMHVGPSHTVRVIAAVGESRDSTHAMLSGVEGIDVEIVLDTHNAPMYGSTEQPERLTALSTVCNAIFGAVRAEDDVLVYVESDLIWDPHTMGSLIDMATRRDGGFDVFAPMPFAGKAFYDIWAFRKDGERFGPFAPYHKAYRANELFEVDSVGSCLVMRGEVARACRVQDNQCLVGWCSDARSKGHKIAVHSAFQVLHP
jgi:hypothetical protein